MKKSLSLLIVAAVALASLFAAPKKSQSKQPVELEYGTDYTIESTWFGEEYFLIDLTSIHFNKGAVNTNHAVILRIVPRELITKNSVIEVEYKMDKYDPSKSAQVCIQPATVENTGAADYSKQGYPIIYNQFEPSQTGVFQVQTNTLLNSSVKDTVDGFRIVNNAGTYNEFTWQDDWGFTITKVTIRPKK